MVLHPKDSRETYQLRDALVDRLKRKDNVILSRPVEAAFRSVPRHVFVPDAEIERAYNDQVIPIKYEGNQVISSSSQPGMMAIMLEQLNLRPGMRVLEIGAGSGYNAALMAHIVGENGSVVSIDIDDDLVEAAREHLREAGTSNARVICADGAYGYADGAPYDRIILSVAAWDITPAWREQLAPDGLLVLPVVLTPDYQTSVVLEMREGVLYGIENVPCRFMTLRGAFAMPDSWESRALVEGIYMYVHERLAGTNEAIYAHLNSEPEIIPTGVIVTSPQLYQGGLWLSLHEPDTMIARAEGDIRRKKLIPCLFSNQDSCTSSGQIAEDGLAFWARRYHEKPKSGRHNPFELVVRAHGPGSTELAARMVAVVQAWEQAGCPQADQARVAIYPNERNVPARPGQFLIPRKSVQIAVWFD